MDLIDPKELEKFINKFKEVFGKEPKLYIWYLPKDPLTIIKNIDSNYDLKRTIENTLHILNLPLDDYDFMYNTKYMINDAGGRLITPLFINTDNYSERKADIMAIGRIKTHTMKDDNEPYRFKTTISAMLGGLRCLCIDTKISPIEILQEAYRCFYIDTLVSNEEKTKDRASNIEVSVETLCNNNINIIDYIPEELRNPEYTRICSQCLMCRIGKTIKSVNRLENNEPPIDVGLLRLVTSDIPHLSSQIIDLCDMFGREFQYEFYTINNVEISKRKNKKWFEEQMSKIKLSLYYQCLNDHAHDILVIDRENNNKIIGMMRYTDYPNDVVYLNTLYLMPEYRNKGLGSWLLQQLYMDTYNNGHSEPIVRLIAYSYNEKVIPFYKKNGFVVHRLNILTSFTPLKKINHVDPLTV